MTYHPRVLARCILAIACLAACGSVTPQAPADVGADASPEDAAPPDAAPPPPAIPRYVYFSHGRGITIGAITDPATGAYRVVSEYQQGERSGLRVAPSGRFLIAAKFGALHVLAIDAATGDLTPAVNDPGTSLHAVGQSAAAFSPDGAFVFVGLDDSSLRAYRFDASTGALAQASVAASLPLPADSVTVTGDGKRLYALAGHHLVAYAIAGDGALAPLAGFPIDLGSDNVPQEIRADPTGQYLALSLYAVEKVAIYAIDATTGAVAEVPGSPYAAQGGPWSGAFSKDGRIYYVACESGLVRSIAIVPGTNALIDGPGSPFAVGTSARTLAFDTEGTLAYVTRYNYVAASILAVQPNGALAPAIDGRSMGGATFNAAIVSGPAPVTFRPRFVYALDNANTGSITAFSMDPSTGALTAIPGGTISVSQPDQAVVDPRGRFLYVISGSSGLHTYQIGATGALAELGTPIAIGSSPHALDISKTGKHLFVAVGGGAQLLSYEIGPAGLPLGSPVPTTTPASTPVDVRFDGVGRQLWAVTANSVSTFNHAFVTEALDISSTTSTGSATQPQSLAMSLDGKHAYVPLAGTNQIAAFALSDTVVTPTAVVGSPFGAGTSPHGAAVDPSGRFVYVTDTGPYLGTAAQRVLAFSRNATTGALAPIAGTFSSLPRPYMATVDPSGKYLVVAATGTLSPTTAGGLSVFPIQSDGTLGTATHTPLGSYLAWVTIVATRD